MIKYELNTISNSKSMLFFGGLITLSRAQCRSLPLSRSAALSYSLQEYLSDAAAAVVAFLAVHVSRTLQVAVAITVFVALSLSRSPALSVVLALLLLLPLLLLLLSVAFFICSSGVAIIFFHSSSSRLFFFF